MTLLVLDPAPSDRIFHCELDAHVALPASLEQIRVLMLRADVGVWVERLGIDLDKVGHPDNPMLVMCGDQYGC